MATITLELPDELAAKIESSFGTACRTSFLRH